MNIVPLILNFFNKEKLDFDIYIIADVQLKTCHLDDTINHADENEFFSRMEFAEIASALFNIFGFGRVFYSESEFIEFILNKRPKTNECLVYNLARDGISEGKKSLIPAFCDLYNLQYTGSNAFIISLLRNKQYFSQILSSNGIATPLGRIYMDTTSYEELKLFENKKVILKNICESASQGLQPENLFLFNHNYKKMTSNALKNLHCKKALMQEYIDGIECEILVLQFRGKYFALDPIQIVFNMHTEFLDSSTSNDYAYSFALIEDDISKIIKAIAIKAAEILNIKDYARFDFRVQDAQPYLIDIAGTPYTIKHSSIAYLFQDIYHLQYEDIFKTIVGCCISNYRIS